ncbi:hypothetical protein O7626_24045 [Micromonospora sp. WMMD1102]|uniref:hypothetical protein n=1 Tax=Micromonospora sp. WMMD1102 TaxID=3016105 RepID=UPI0024152A7C|nr:hypothetical protein [Micromonospora sp. WMMD1102]MDG4788963.1 hypothetical protein [Micromonospora sp. WMMD1102]
MRLRLSSAGALTRPVVPWLLGRGVTFRVCRPDREHSRGSSTVAGRDMSAPAARTTGIPAPRAGTGSDQHAVGLVQ